MKKLLIAALMLIGAQAFGLDAVTDADFQAKVLKAKGFVVVVAGRADCPPCQLYAPNVEGASKKLSQAKFYDLDVTKNEESDAYLGIQATPTTAVFRDGKPLAIWTGATALESELTTVLSNVFKNADKLLENTAKLEELYNKEVELRKANRALIQAEESK